MWTSDTFLYRPVVRACARVRAVAAVLAVAVLFAGAVGCQRDAASPSPVLEPGNALVGRYFTGVDALGLVFSIDRLEPAGGGRYTVVGRARGSLADLGGDVECAFGETGVIDGQNIDLVFTPGEDCPPAFGTSPVSVRLRLKLSGVVTGPDAFRGVPVEAEPY